MFATQDTELERALERNQLVQQLRDALRGRIEITSDRYQIITARVKELSQPTPAIRIQILEL